MNQRGEVFVGVIGAVRERHSVERRHEHAIGFECVSCITACSTLD
jgi:hypothetical protein